MQETSTGGEEMTSRDFREIISAINYCYFNGPGCIDCPAEKLCTALYSYLNRLIDKQISNAIGKGTEVPWRSPSGHY
jgi:hypothetical protein